MLNKKKKNLTEEYLQHNHITLCGKSTEQYMETINTKFCLVFNYVGERMKNSLDKNKRGFNHSCDVLFLKPQSFGAW